MRDVRQNEWRRGLGGLSPLGAPVPNVLTLTPTQGIPSRTADQLEGGLMRPCSRLGRRLLAVAEPPRALAQLAGTLLECLGPKRCALPPLGGARRKCWRRATRALLSHSPTTLSGLRRKRGSERSLLSPTPPAGSLPSGSGSLPVPPPPSALRLVLTQLPSTSRRALYRAPTTPAPSSWRPPLALAAIRVSASPPTLPTLLRMPPSTGSPEGPSVSITD